MFSKYAICLKINDMNSGKTILAQIMEFTSRYEFDKCVKKYKGHYKVQKFTCWEQFVVMSFAQLTYRESLRDIEASLNAVSDKLYHCGIKNRIAKSTLADANEQRDWHIYSDFAHVLINEARILYRNDNDFNLELDEIAYALDSTTIDLCLSLFPWAKFRKKKGAVKMHTLLDLRGSIPTVIEITDGKLHDVNILDQLVIEAGAFYVMDKGYIDFERLYDMHLSGAYFVIREKDNCKSKLLKSNKIDKKEGLRCDQIIKLTGTITNKNYPEQLRRIGYYDKEEKIYYVYLTNNFKVNAFIIAQLYKKRWQIELFFKWIKQHLKIKTFYGTTYNAVCTQIWIAISVYLIIAIAKQKLMLKRSPYSILQIFSVCIFEKTPIYKLLGKDLDNNNNQTSSNQLSIFTL